MSIIDDTQASPIESIEQALLAAILTSPAAYDAAAQSLHEMSPRHDPIWAACKYLVETSEMAQLDWRMVVARLESTGDLDLVGGKEYIRELTMIPVNVENAEAMAAELAQRFARRAVQEQVLASVEAFRGEMTREQFEERLAEHYAGLESAARLASGKNPFPQIAEVGDLDDALDYIMGDKTMGESTGLPELDDAIGGLKAGQLVVIGAQSGTGKTTIVQHLAEHIALKGNRPLLSFSPEMDRHSLNLRLLCSLGQVNTRKIISKEEDVTEVEMARLVDAAARIREMRWDVNHEQDITVERIVALIGAYKRLNPELKVVTVDHIGIIGFAGKSTGMRRDEVLGEISWKLRQVARRLDITVVLLTQLNEGATKREDKRPEVSDVKESKKIVENADVVVLMHRWDRIDRESPQAGEMLLRVVKNRNGANRDLTILHQLHYSRISGDPMYAAERARRNAA